ncbi:MAG: M15 family metallopeptidase [Pseudoxanthomonas sp.]
MIKPHSALCWLLLSGWLFACCGCATSTDSAAPVEISDATTATQAGLVDIETLVADIALDMRYAGNDNFVGARVDGYGAPRCYLRQQAAHALAAVEQDVREQGFRLKIFDCYRPARAVAHFMRWAEDPNDQRTKARHYPRLEKPALLNGYIARVSGHSRGSTVDLTLMDCRSGPCVAMDMATEFDFFDVRANTDTPGLSVQQRQNRQRLRQALEQQGFVNYEKEWWHFTYAADPSKALFDVPIE